MVTPRCLHTNRIPFLGGTRAAVALSVGVAVGLAEALAEAVGLRVAVGEAEGVALAVPEPVAGRPSGAAMPHKTIVEVVLEEDSSGGLPVWCCVPICYEHQMK